MAGKNSSENTYEVFVILVGGHEYQNVNVGFSEKGFDMIQHIDTAGVSALLF